MSIRRNCHCYSVYDGIDLPRGGDIPKLDIFQRCFRIVLRIASYIDSGTNVSFVTVLQSLSMSVYISLSLNLYLHSKAGARVRRYRSAAAHGNASDAVITSMWTICDIITCPYLIRNKIGTLFLREKTRR